MRIEKKTRTSSFIFVYCCSTEAGRKRVQAKGLIRGDSLLCYKWVTDIIIYCLPGTRSPSGRTDLNGYVTKKVMSELGRYSGYITAVLLQTN